MKFSRSRRLLLALFGCGGAIAAGTCSAQRLDSLAGERGAEALKRSIENEEYNIQHGPVGLRVGASASATYTDNVFYSSNRQDDFILSPEVTLEGAWRITELNILRLTLGLGYEWYLDNNSLNSDAPLVNPGSELVFNIFAGDFRIRLHERFSYQESLHLNSVSADSGRFFNLNDVGIFKRIENHAGFNVDWDLNELVLSAGYDHENFISNTDQFDYLTRASEWFTLSAAFALGDRAHAGAEARAGLHNYDEDVMADNWRARVGPFVEFNLMEGISLRAGGGFDGGWHDGPAADTSDFESAYGYARIRQETRLFTHQVSAGREHLLGDNANTMRTTYVRYSIFSPIFANIDVGANVSANFAKEFGGVYYEEFDYYILGCRIGWQFHRYWRADLGYEFRLKESDTILRDYHRNRVTLAANFTF